MVVAFSGSRFPVSSSSANCVQAVLASISNLAWGLASCGCCPTGIDLLVRQIISKINLPWRLFSVEGKRSAESLRSRTLKMVSNSEVLFSFPQSSSFARSGTWLATFAAFNSNKPVFVFLPNSKVSELPLVRGVRSWSVVEGSSLKVPVPGFKFFVPSSSTTQTNLFHN